MVVARGSSHLGARPPPRSCDTFVYVGGLNGPAHTIFGKNSDRPADEEHEVVTFPAATHAPGSVVKCTHISIPQAEATLAVVLSRPRWLWGCEMGANEKGVVGGNEAVSSVLADDLGDQARLLGMDLLRLALERGGTAREAVQHCCKLLEEHGQVCATVST
jgi:secernin